MTMTRFFALPLAALCAALAWLPAQGFANDARELKWADLIAPAATQSALKPKTFFAGSTPEGEDGAPPPPLAEGKFMQMKRRQPGAGQPPAVVATLDGQRVSIGGYVVPLDFEATKIKEFLLVPFVGACIHVPPPPANQIIYVQAAEGFEVTGPFDPVTVTGTMKTAVAFTGLADAGYTLQAETVQPRKE
jgi:uncharacterized protein